jgi:phosphoglycerol transferase MdoB-like AlkP superfamily enzyme
MSKKIQWGLFILYLMILGTYCGLEIDSFTGDLPFFKLRTFLLFLNVLFILLLPMTLCAALSTNSFLRKYRILRLLILPLSSFLFYFALFLALYKSIRKMDFDFYFLWYNTADALPALWKLFAPWIPVVLLLLAAFIVFHKEIFAPVIRWTDKTPSKAWSTMGVILIGSMLCQLITMESIRGSAAGFIYASFLSDRKLRDDYRQLYKSHITALQKDAPKTSERYNTSALGDVVFMVKQESLNGLLTGPRITPHLLSAAKDGILFPKMYGNSIQSLRGYECILCGVPPSATDALVDEYAPQEIKKLSCLPKLFKKLGYHTLYFFGGSQNKRIVSFATSAGFENVLSDDIMQPEDAKFDWGYREDIFYTRIYQYLQKHFVNEKLFVFIDTGATNHTPFKVLDEDHLNAIPFPDPQEFEENLSNTTFVQDAYFGELYQRFKKLYGNNGSLIAVSDHSWPIPIHKDNIYNERGAYEENFLISLLFVPPASKKALFDIGTVVPLRFSQMDILPTVLDLLGMEQKSLLGTSFASWLQRPNGEQRSQSAQTNISIQPYGGGFISVVRYPQKYLFSVLGRNVEVFDLEKDPEERSPAIHNLDQHMPLIRNFFQKNNR